MGTLSIRPIEGIMEILHVVNNTKHIGKFYVHNIRRLDNEISDKYTVIILNITDRGHQ